MNDISDGMNSSTNLFANDAKLLRHIKNKEDCKILQKVFNKIWRWSRKLEIEFNVDKSRVMKLGRSVR